MTQHIPFTYLVTFTHPDTLEKFYYYGSKYGKDCHPNDLWTTYFTSSKEILSLIEQFGKDVFTATIRRTFPGDPKRCVQFETNVLRRLNVIHNPKWLNKSFGPYYLKTPGQNAGKVVMSNPKTEKHRYVNQEDVNEFVNKGWEFGYPEYRKGRKIMHLPSTGEQKQFPVSEISLMASLGWVLGYPEEVNKKKSEARKAYMATLTDEERSKLGFGNPDRVSKSKGKPSAAKGRKKIHHPVTGEMTSVPKEKLEEYLSNGWLLGESSWSKEKKSKTNGRHERKPLTKEQRLAMSERTKKQIAEKGHPRSNKTNIL
ncbi:GIY-YIG domain-containing protein [Ochrobactrum phage vB_OspM_OC]|nr:GIY-YIG domain-containing protein [Ochrobactrum phage vB_OspM_OC]